MYIEIPKNDLPITFCTVPEPFEVPSLEIAQDFFDRMPNDLLLSQSPRPLSWNLSFLSDSVH